MSPLPDDEVRQRIVAVRDRILAATKAARTPKKPGKVMPEPATDAVPPPPHAEPEEDRKP